jgi:hypothetical protein
MARREEDNGNGMDTKEDSGRGTSHATTSSDDTSAAATKAPASSTSASTSTEAGAASESEKQTPSPNTVIMFDWDDTLLASSFLSSRGYRLDSDGGVTPEVDAQLRALEQCVCAVLQLALTYGHVNIVTNAETGWVQLSAQKFMPAVVPLLSKVTVISARSTFEAAHPDAPLKWKFYAFHERLSAVFGASSFGADDSTSSDVHKNIISFGDSHVEREAIRAVTRGVSQCRTKSVKFAERPTPEQLRRQLELVTNCFQYIHNHPADLDLQLTVTLNAPASPPSPPQSHSSSSSSVPSLSTTEVL